MYHLEFKSDTGRRPKEKKALTTRCYRITSCTLFKNNKTIATSVVTRHFKDQDCKVIGQYEAVKKVLKFAELDKEERTEV